MDLVHAEDFKLVDYINAGQSNALPEKEGKARYRDGGGFRGHDEEGKSLNKEHTMKDFEKQVTDLKRENFNLKLRIYFLEEQIQQSCESSSEDLHRMNVELKVEVESLKNDLQEKQKLLLKASKAMESLALEGGNTQQTKEDCPGQEEGSSKLCHLENELQIKHAEMNTIRALLDQEQTQRFEAEAKLLAAEEQYRRTTVVLEERDLMISHLNETLDSKEALIIELKRQLAATEPDAHSTSNVPERNNSLDVCKGKGHDENELGYKQLILSLKAEKEMYSQLINSVGERGSLQKELDTVAALQRQLLEKIRSNEELGRMLEDQLKAHCRENDTVSFFGERTSYLNICLDYLDQNFEYRVERDLQEKEAENNLQYTGSSDGNYGLTNQYLVASRDAVVQSISRNAETEDVLDASLKEEENTDTRLVCQSSAVFEGKHRDASTSPTIQYDINSGLEYSDVENKILFRLKHDVDWKNGVDVGTQVEIDQEDTRERSFKVPKLQMEESVGKSTAVSKVETSAFDKENAVYPGGHTEQHWRRSASGFERGQANSLTERKNSQNDKLNNFAKRSQIPVLQKSSSGTQLTAKSLGCLSSAQNEPMLQLHNYQLQINKLTEQLHCAYLELEGRRSGAVLMEDCCAKNSNCSEHGSSHTPSRLVPGYGVLSDERGRYVLGFLEDYDALWKQILEGRSVLLEIDADIDNRKSADHFDNILYDKIRRTAQCLEEAVRLMHLLWRVSLPSHVHRSNSVAEVEKMRMEIVRLRKSLVEQKQLVSGMMNRFYAESQYEDSVRLILDQVSMTHEVLKRARRNLEKQPAKTHD
ncbi:CDK5 regulatory subunit-associated protein 2-like [Spea bombifrons]|uniref:CDK5 regulatory subunit-associated protein 2-like n=1 Tax=Spea bombifrons TaxID=233779 RepID=UPI00234B978C|nr:CDK5 regulatory subunit-associated protein 2-like [Spea bombifrons]